MFMEGPVLATFDSLRTTVVECVSSRYNVGGVLSQYDDDGLLRQCAFFSKKANPAECNLFDVMTEHKNLEYFFSPRKLTERHIRWQLLLSRFNFFFRYRPGKESVVVDALSRREQDLPQKDDERLDSRTIQLLNLPVRGGAIAMAPIQLEGEERDGTRPPSYDHT